MLDYIHNCNYQTFVTLFDAVKKISYSDIKFGDELGRGATGAVYKGDWLSRNIQVAIKRVVGKINREEVSVG